MREVDLEFLKGKAEAVAFALQKDQRIKFYISDSSVFYYGKAGEKPEKIGHKDDLEKWLINQYDNITDYRMIFWRVAETLPGADGPTYTYFKDRNKASEYAEKTNGASGPVHTRLWKYEVDELIAERRAQF